MTGVFVGSVSACSSALSPLASAVAAGTTYRFVGPESYLTATMIEAGCEGKPVAQCAAPAQSPFVAKSSYVGGPLPEKRGHRNPLRPVVAPCNASRSWRRRRVRWLRRGDQSGGGERNGVRPSERRPCAQYSITYASAAPTPDEVSEASAWLQDLHQAFEPVTQGSYQNYIDPDLAHWQQAYYGSNLSRLRQVKRKYDPDDIFHFAQSIPTLTCGGKKRDGGRRVQLAGMGMAWRAPPRRPLGGRPQFLLIDFPQDVCESRRRTSLASRARGDGRKRVVVDPKASGHGSMVEVAVLPGAHDPKAPESRVEGGAETEARTVHRVPFGRIALRPPQRRRAFLGNSDPSRPHVRTCRVGLELDGEPFLRHAGISIGRRQPDSRWVLFGPECQKSTSSHLSGHSYTLAVLGNDKRSAANGPGMGDCRTGIAAAVEHNSHLTRDGGWERMHCRLEALQ